MAVRYPSGICQWDIGTAYSSLCSYHDSYTFLGYSVATSPRVWRYELQPCATRGNLSFLNDSNTHASPSVRFAVVHTPLLNPTLQECSRHHRHGAYPPCSATCVIWRGGGVDMCSTLTRQNDLYHSPAPNTAQPQNRGGGG